MGPAFKSSKIGDQKFSAPNLPVAAVSRTVECDANHFSSDVILRHTTGDMRVVMLHSDFVFDRK